MCPPRKPSVSISRGRHPVDSRYLTLAPLAVRASTKGPIGRCFIRALPVMIVDLSFEAEPETMAQTVARNRLAVPALPR